MSQPTPSELEILEILWPKGEATAQAVHDVLSQEKDVGYTTTLKLMQIMAQKKLLGRKKEGRSHIYFPLVDEKETKEGILDRFVKNTFSGSKLKLVMHLLGDKKVSSEEIRDIRAFLDEVKKKK